MMRRTECDTNILAYVYKYISSEANNRVNKRVCVCLKFKSEKRNSVLYYIPDLSVMYLYVNIVGTIVFYYTKLTFGQI